MLDITRNAPPPDSAMTGSVSSARRSTDRTFRSSIRSSRSIASLAAWLVEGGARVRDHDVDASPAIARRLHERGQLPGIRHVALV